jgi:hypothetical protein
VLALRPLLAWTATRVFLCLVVIATAITITTRASEAAPDIDTVSLHVVYAYDSPTASTTQRANTRIAALRINAGDATEPWSLTSPILRGLAAEVGDEFFNLASDARTTHILHGDATGGGHLWPGLTGKTPFPTGWSETRSCMPCPTSRRTRR